MAEGIDQPLVPVLSKKLRGPLLKQEPPDLEKPPEVEVTAASDSTLPNPLTVITAALAASKQNNNNNTVEPLPLWVSPSSLIMGRLKTASCFNPLLNLITRRSSSILENSLLLRPVSLTSQSAASQPQIPLMLASSSNSNQPSNALPDLGNLFLLQNHILTMISKVRKTFEKCQKYIHVGLLATTNMEVSVAKHCVTYM